MGADVAGRLDRRTVIDEARRAGVISRTAHHVAAALNDYADPRGILRGLGYADLAYLLALSKATVYRAVRELCATGLVVRLQQGRGWRKASYAVASNSSRGDLRRLRSLPMCSQPRIDTFDKKSLKALTHPVGFSFSGRDVHEPERAWAIVQARGVLPDSFDERECRQLVHLAAACARRSGVAPPKLLRWLLTVPAARTLPFICNEHDRREATRTLREADERERLATLRAAERRRPPATWETSPPRRDPAASQAAEGPLLLGDLYAEALQAEQEGLA